MSARQRLLSGAGIILLGLAACCGQARAASIGINFATDATGANFDLSANDVTGVVPQAHWNNYHVFPTANPVVLVDDQNQFVLIPQPVFVPGLFFGSSRTSNVPVGTSSGNLLHSEEILSSFIFHTIPYPQYDLYVYFAAAPEPFPPPFPQTEFGLFIQNHAPVGPFRVSNSGSATFSEASATVAGNYIHISGLSGGLSVSFDRQVAVGGLQIVSIPEPPSWVLATIVAFIPLAWRRPKQAAA